MSRDVYELYRDKLRPKLASLEHERKATLERMKQSGLLIGGSAGVIALGIAFLGRSAFALVFAGAIIVGAIFLWQWRNKDQLQAFTLRFKQEVIAEAVALYGQNIRYDPTAGIDRYEFRESELFKGSVDRYQSEDLIHGLLGETQFRCSEVFAEEKRTRTDSKGRRETYYVTLFKGVYFHADFNKNFHGSTFVLPDNMGAKPGGIGQQIQRLGSAFNRRGELVKLEDPEFERLFVVYSDDQTTARYILSTSLMARLVDFQKKHNERLHVAFNSGKIYVAISSTKNLLEPPIRQSLLSVNLLKDYLEDLDVMVGVVEDLNLNQRIWTSEAV